MNEQTISIIIPIYNVEDYIRKCLQSVLDQTYASFQAILVNDGSTDHSVEICEEMVAGDSRFILIPQENRGLSAARNTGLHYVKGDYVLYLDSDDSLVPNALELLLGAAQKYGADIVQGNFYYDYPDYLLLNEQQKHEETVYTRDDAMTALLEHKTIMNFAWGKLISAVLAKKHQFPEGKYFEDTCWKAKLIHDCTTYAALKAPVLYYLQRPSSISGKFSIRNLDQLDAEIERLQFLKQNYPACAQQAFYVLYSKFRQHSVLIKFLEKEEAETYAKRLTELGEPFLFEPNSQPDLTIYQKLGGILKKLSYRLIGTSEWKKIKKRNSNQAKYLPYKLFLKKSISA